MCVSPHRICNIVNAEIQSFQAENSIVLAESPRIVMISFRKTRRSRALGGSQHSYANRSAVSPRCYPFGNLCVANFAGFPVALESVMQDDALRNQRPNLPPIYTRRKICTDGVSRN